MRRYKDYVLLFFKGMGMGGADVIPGVSGGTIAFITGIYEELINSIRSVDAKALSLLLRFRVSEFGKKINAAFLFTVLAGIATSLISFAALINYLLSTYPIPVWSLFFGLILASSPLILREIKTWNLGIAFSGILGVIIAYTTTTVSPAETPSTLWFIFICGISAICAMILPGISGAFILLLLGQYEFMIKALVSVDLLVISVFILGCMIGLLAFSRILSWILKDYRFPTLALLSGFMIGSLNKIWPWKEVISFKLDRHGDQIAAIDRSILPGEYFDKTGNDPLIFQAILFVAIGVFIVVFMEKLAIFFKNQSLNS